MVNYRLYPFKENQVVHHTEQESYDVLLQSPQRLTFQTLSARRNLVAAKPVAQRDVCIDS